MDMLRSRCVKQTLDVMKLQSMFIFSYVLQQIPCSVPGHTSYNFPDKGRSTLNNFTAVKQLMRLLVSPSAVLYYKKELKRFKASQ